MTVGIKFSKMYEGSVMTNL